MPSVRNLLAIPLFAALCALLAGCPGRIEDPIAFRAEAAMRCPTDFDVEEDLFARTCGVLGCHTGGPALSAAGLDLATDGVRGRLLVHVSTNDECGDRPLLTPGDLTGSFLYQKVGPEPPCGDRMPAGLPPLNPTELACLEAYLTELVGGAGGDGGTPPPPFDAGAPPDAGPRDAGSMTPTAMTLQAEAMTLTTYMIDAIDATLIRLPDTATTGTARTTFSGVAGTYQLTVHAVAEIDGQPQLTIRADGTDVATATYPLSTADMEAITLGPYAVDLSPGDEILLEGTVDGGAWARIDRVELAP